jgi:LmbE family N-acetylglucosaminyl deacetylase
MDVSELDLTGRVAVIVAHPDDETMWAGTLLARYNGFDVIACSIPRRDPVRADLFTEAVALLGHNPIVIDIVEPTAKQPMTYLGLVPVDYDVIFTHNRRGEYGHLHHINVHQYVIRYAKETKIYTFGYGSGSIQLNATVEEQRLRFAALQCYNHISPSDKLPKWEALLKRYRVDLTREYYNEQ